VHLANLPKPSLDDIPNGRGVLVKVLRVGVDGTDREINPRTSMSSCLKVFIC
jgi:threonine dehydrogenase-like Zn-dependent dehydrogenase